MTGTILISTDGSELANRAAERGLALLAPGHDLVLVTVVEQLELTVGAPVSGFAATGVSPEELERTRSAVLEEGQRVVEQAARELGLSDARLTVLEGAAGPAICDYAVEVGAEAIVMGSRGRGGVKRALLGSVSDHVVRNAPCPVVITHPSSD